MNLSKAQRSAMTMLALDAIDLYIISEELKDAFEDELMRKDIKSWEITARTILTAMRRK